MDEQVGAAEHGGDVADASRQQQTDAERLGLRLQRLALRPFAEHDERRVESGQRFDRDVEPLLLREP